MEKNNACLFSVCVTDLPGQRGDFLVESGFGFFFFFLPSDQNEKCDFFCFPTLVADVMGWWCPLVVLTLWRGFSPAELGAAKRSSSYTRLDR